MDKDKNPIKMRLSEQLPSHSPDPGSWQRLSAKLDSLDAEAVYQEKLQQLPIHSPDQSTWAVIYSRLNRISFYKTATRIAISAAAGLLLFFTVSRVSDYYQTHVTTPQFATRQQTIILPEVLIQKKPIAAQEPVANIKNNRPNSANQTKTVVVSSNVNQEPRLFELEPTPTPKDNESALNTEMPLAVINNTPEPIVPTVTVHDTSLQNNSIMFTDNDPLIAALQLENKKTKTQPDKYYTPKEPKAVSSKNNFALGMNYLPENIYNGTDNSLFHNVDFTASYNKEKVRFNTSLGMAYNEEQLEFDMNYDINTPVTAPGPDGNMDTVGYNVSSMESQYQGTEKHQYFTYNLGLGRRLFSAGKFSTWINVGTGFGIKLNDPNLISSTEKSIKTRYNAQITNVNTSQPIYNDVNVNFVTGIDFNYKFFNRLSFSFSPTSRWYFKPVLTIDNQPTDELTLGFKTGMKFDF